MSSIGFQDRARIAGAIRACRVVVAEEVTDEFLTRHPEWQAQHGDRARQLGMEDACYHQDFLAAAIESGEAESFRQYGDWAGRILTARHIEPRFLVENLEQIGQSLRVRLPAADAATVDSFIRSGVDRCLPDGTAVGSNPGGALELLTAMYTDAAIRGNRQAALNLLLDAATPGSSGHRPLLGGATRRDVPHRGAVGRKQNHRGPGTYGYGHNPVCLGTPVRTHRANGNVPR